MHGRNMEKQKMEFNIEMQQWSHYWSKMLALNRVL